MSEKAFVIMPFTFASSKSGAYHDLSKDDFDTIFDILKEILKEKMIVNRSDSVSNILREIVIDIDSSDLVIADLTGLNPNVMYELGIRHALCKKTILITQDIEEIPFDLRGYFCIQYGWKTTKEKTKLSNDLIQTIQKINDSPDNRYGPYHTYIGIKKETFKNYEYIITCKRLASLQTEMKLVNINARHEIIEYTKRGYKGIEIRLNERTKMFDYFKVDYEQLTKDQVEILNSEYQMLSLVCCEKLISDVYVPHQFNKFEEVEELITNVRILTNIKSTNANFSKSNSPHLDVELAYKMSRTLMISIGNFIYAIENNITNTKISEIELK